jgi:hypothetical protein
LGFQPVSTPVERSTAAALLRVTVPGLALTWVKKPPRYTADGETARALTGPSGCGVQTVSNAPVVASTRAAL